MSRSAVADTDEEDDTPLSSRLERTDGIWEAKERSFFESDFFEHVGPNNLLDSVKTPGEVYLCLFSENLIDIIVEQSNVYCTQKNLKFEPITSDEIKKFFGLNIIMGIKRSPSYRDYWSTDFQMNDPYIS